MMKLNKRTVARIVLWQDFMSSEATDDGTWVNSKWARAKLPDYRFMTDRRAQNFIEWMAQNGYLTRVSRSCYTVTRKRPRPIVTWGREETD